MTARGFLAGRGLSFRHAARGVVWLLRSQLNMRIHLGVALLVVILGFALNVTRGDWLWLIAAIFLVFVAEGTNTAIELLGDAVSAEYDPLVGKAKDVAAGAVLLASIGAAIIGLVIFIPYFSR